MTNVVDGRNLIQSEEVSYRSAVSESTFTRMGASINHIMNKQHDKHTYNFNGPYSIAAGGGNDGMFIFNVDMEITFLSMSSITSGISGTTTLDIHWLNGSGVDAGTIFSTKPSINFNSPNNAYLLKDVVNNSNIVTTTGGTMPVLSKTQFAAGNAIRCDIDAVMASAENCSLNLYFRPL